MAGNYHKHIRQATDIIRKDAEEAWPQDFFALAGRFPDFPLRAEIDASHNSDAPRLVDVVDPTSPDTPSAPGPMR
jgi:hypothetical protein